MLFKSFFVSRPFSVLRSRSCVLGLLVTVLSLPSPCHAGFGFDAGQDVATYVNSLDAAGVTGRNGQWLRVRGLAVGGGEGDHAGRTVEGDRAALVALHERGVRVCVILRWGPAGWSGGVRVGGGHRLPLDLREAYERGHRLGQTYGDLVDAWEIENEPDIDFVAENPETYAAFQKAIYLGLHGGARAASPAGLRLKVELKGQSAGSSWLARKRGSSRLGLKLSSSTHEWRAPLVIMAPLALPPGPYLERIRANGIASYTDGFNYHYYGFAEDFSGVHGQFCDAVAEPGAARSSVEVEEGRLRDGSCSEGNLKFETSSGRHGLRTWPVFITEYGYGLLDADSRDTVEGRARQWRWFADVAGQIRDLRIAAPMAFILNPYFEANLNEFGLTTKLPLEFRSGARGNRNPVKGEGRRGAPAATSGPAGNAKANAPDGVGSPPAEMNRGAEPPLRFAPADLGEKKPKAWMNRIGRKVGEWHASPALAYLWDYAERKPYRPNDWAVRVEPPSPVVIDFIAGDDLAQRKVSGGHVLHGRWVPAELLAAPTVEATPRRTGLGRVVVYNFSDTAVSGRLDMTGGDGVWISWIGCRLTLAPGERRELGVELAVQAQSFAAGAYRVTFTPDAPETGTAVWETRLLPDAAGMPHTVERGFDFPAEAAAKNRRLLAERPLANGEAGLKPDGRWLVTDGVRVEERDGVWRFHINCLPAEAMRPAAVELPLPEGFVFPAGTWLTMERRRADDEVFNHKGREEPRSLRSEGAARPHELSASRLKSRAGRAGNVMDVYFRTENGNLFQTWPRLRVTDEWTRYGGMAEDFTMGFFGRAALPWRFSENRPASLVFYLRPSQVPAVFEVRDALILRTGAARESRPKN
jgi:hypothetical protein